jgi:hypothetical protein
VPTDAFEGLPFLVLLVGNEYGQVGNENGAGNDQSFHAASSCGRAGAACSTGGEPGAEDEIAGANGVRRPFGLNGIGDAFRIVEDLPF